MARLWSVVDGEPFMVNPTLAVWNPRRRRSRKKGVRAMAGYSRRRSSRRRARARRRNPVMIPLNPRRRHRVKGFSYSRRGRRVRVRSHMSNPYRRRHYRRNDPARMRGAFDVWGVMPLVGAGVGAGLAIGYVTPMLTRTFNIAPVGIMYRAVQGGVALLGAWALRSMNVVRPSTAAAFAGTGLALVGLGLIQDWQSGALTGATAPAGAAGMGAYRQAMGRYAVASSSGGAYALPHMNGYSVVR